MSVGSEMIERDAIAARECQAVWRCAIGDVTSAIDILQTKWVNSRRKHEREAGVELKRLADLIWAARGPAPSNYSEAFQAGKRMHALVRSAMEGE